MEIKQNDLSSIIRSKLRSVDDNAWWNDESETAPDRNVVKDVRKKFSYLLHIFRIFLLVYHSTTWTKILETTGVSRQQKFEEIDICD